MGAKWDACDPKIVKKTKTYFLVQCDTAWNPPILWAKNACQLFPTLTFRIAYVERGCQVYGLWKQNISKRINLEKKYTFRADEIRHYNLIDGKKIYDEEGKEDEISERLTKFMKRYSVAHLGG